MPRKVTPRPEGKGPAVAIYEATAHIDGVPSGSEGLHPVMTALNQAWGYADGRVNKYNKKGDLVPIRKNEDPGMLEAHHQIHGGLRVKFYVYVFKDGSKVIERDKPSQAWKRASHGTWIRRSKPKKASTLWVWSPTLHRSST